MSYSFGEIPWIGDRPIVTYLSIRDSKGEYQNKGLRLCIWLTQDSYPRSKCSTELKPCEPHTAQ